MTILNRELFAKTGREWFEPTPDELAESTTELRTLSQSQKCAKCNEFQPPQVMRVRFERQRTWKQTGAISGKFSEWGEWIIVGFECLKCDSEIPF